MAAGMLSPAWPPDCDDSGILCIDCQSGGHSSAAHSFLGIRGMCRPRVCG